MVGTPKIMKVKKGKKLQKGKKKPEKKFSEELLVEAMNAIEGGEYSLRSAARMYDIPKSTLWTRITYKVPH